MGLSRVAVPKGEGYVTVSLEEFVAMPLDHRVSLVLEQRLRFYDEGGTLLSTAEGLKLLRQMRQASVPAAT